MYELLKNRLENGHPFLKSVATERINALANALEITQEQADELMALVESNGVDVMPEDFSERLARIEEVIEKVKRFFAAASENVLLSSIMQAIEEKEDGDSL